MSTVYQMERITTLPRGRPEGRVRIDKGKHIFLRLASLGGRPQAQVHMEGMKCRVFYLNVLGMNTLHAFYTILYCHFHPQRERICGHGSFLFRPPGSVL